MNDCTAMRPRAVFPEVGGDEREWFFSRCTLLYSLLFKNDVLSTVFQTGVCEKESCF